MSQIAPEIVVNEPNRWRLETPGANWPRSARPDAAKKYFMVSADGHANEPANLWFERMDKKYHERLPRVVTDKEGVQWRYCEGYRPDRLRLSTLEGEDMARNKAGAEPLGRLADHDRDPNPHAPDARAAAHDVGIECDAIEHGSTPCPSPLRFLDRSETLDAAPPVERWSRPQLRQMLHPNQDRWVAGGQPERPARLLERVELLDSHQSSRRANFAFRSAASAWSIGRNVSFFIR